MARQRYRSFPGHEAGETQGRGSRGRKGAGKEVSAAAKHSSSTHWPWDLMLF